MYLHCTPLECVTRMPPSGRIRQSQHRSSPSSRKKPSFLTRFSISLSSERCSRFAPRNEGAYGGARGEGGPSAATSAASAANRWLAIVGITSGTNGGLLFGEPCWEVLFERRKEAGSLFVGKGRFLCSG